MGEDLKKQLTEAKVKPKNFAIVVKAGNYEISLSKKKILPGTIKEMKEKAGGGAKVVTGVVSVIGGTLKFRSLDDVSPLRPVQLKAYIKAETSLGFDVAAEKVATLEDVSEEDFESAKSPVDVTDRRRKELAEALANFKGFKDGAPAEIQKFAALEADAKQKRAEINVLVKAAEAALKASTDDAEKKKLKDDIVVLKKSADDAFQLMRDAKDNATGVVNNVKNIDATMAEYAAAGKDFDKQYEAVLHGRLDAIKAVKTKLDAVYEQTQQKLVILGRTKDTFEGDSSWLAKNPGQEGRVLNEGDWSMGVNDAFIDAGLTQKAEFAMITKLKDEVKKDIKKLLMNQDGRSKDELKAEVRKIAKAKADPALFTGGRFNDGFAVSMVELEQLIDDGYVMMEHDPSGRGKASDKQAPEQVMVPSGVGQKIKGELAGATAKQEDPQKRAQVKKLLDGKFAAILKEDGIAAMMKNAPDVKQAVQNVKVALDRGELIEANLAIEQLKKSVAEARQNSAGIS